MPTAVYAASEDWGGDGKNDIDDLAARISRAAGELAGLMAGRPSATAPAETVIPFAQQLAALRPA